MTAWDVGDVPVSGKIQQTVNLGFGASVGNPRRRLLSPSPLAVHACSTLVIAPSPTQTSLARRLYDISSILSRREALLRYSTDHISPHEARD